MQMSWEHYDHVRIEKTAEKSHMADGFFLDLVVYFS